MAARTAAGDQAKKVVLAICVCIAVAGCSDGYGEFKGLGDWEGGYEPLGVAAEVEAYQTVLGSGTVSLSLVCTSTEDKTPLTMISWDGYEYLDGDVWAEFLFDDTRYVVQHWYSTFGNVAGPVGEETANEFLVALRRSDRMSVVLNAYSGTVQAAFNTKGIQTILQRMNERCD